MRKLLLILLTCFAFSTSVFAGPVNLNTATAVELETLKGVGPVKAKAIVDYRAKNSSFKSVDDLEMVPGFGKKTVDSLRADLTVSAGAAPSKSKIVADAKKGAAAPAKADDKAAKKDDSKKAADKK